MHSDGNTRPACGDCDRHVVSQRVADDARGTLLPKQPPHVRVQTREPTGLPPQKVHRPASSPEFLKQLFRFRLQKGDGGLLPCLGGFLVDEVQGEPGTAFRFGCKQKMERAHDVVEAESGVSDSPCDTSRSMTCR